MVRLDSNSVKQNNNNNKFNIYLFNFIKYIMNPTCNHMTLKYQNLTIKTVNIVENL